MGPGAQLSHCWSWLPDLLTLFGTLGWVNEQFFLAKGVGGRRVPLFPTSSFRSCPSCVEGTSRAGIWAMWLGWG